MPAEKKSKEFTLEKTEKAVKKPTKKVKKDIEEVKGDTESKTEEIIEQLEETADELVEKEKKSPKKKLKEFLNMPIENKKEKLTALIQKAKQLEETVLEVETVDLKKKIKAEEEERADTLVQIEDYLKSSIHLGTRVITPDMRPYVYKRRADGLAVFNTTLLDLKIREAADFLSNYAPEDVIAVCKREAGWKALELFSSITGIKIFTKQYPPGILTNPNLEIFREAELVLISDPWIDKNAFNDALRIKMPVLAICDTNNYTKNITKVLPGNNKSAKSLGMIFYLLAKIYIQKRKIKKEIPAVMEWIENWETLQPPK